MIRAMLLALIVCLAVAACGPERDDSGAITEAGR